jgi:hypothetical protein
MAEKSLVIPTIHLNGTAYGDLFEQVMTAREALEAAIRALDQMSPNGCDYYLQGDVAIMEASSQHSDRIRAVEKVAEELYEIAIGISDQEGRV